MRSRSVQQKTVTQRSAGGVVFKLDDNGNFEILIVVTLPDGSTRPVAIDTFRAIDADSSPIRWRGCFTLDPTEVGDAAPYPQATPLNGPNWFQCYSARALTADLEAGAARASLGQSEVHPDVDRVIAVYPDGRAFG